MIVRRGKFAFFTTVEIFDGCERVTHVIVGSSPLDCSKLAGRRIKSAMKAGHEIAWNANGGNKIRMFRSTDEYSSGDRYIRSRLMTVPERGRVVEHAERRRANASYEGLAECEICHMQKVGVSSMRNDAVGRDMLVCRTDRRVIKLVNAQCARAAAAASASSAADPAASADGCRCGGEGEGDGGAAVAMAKATATTPSMGA